MTPSELRWWMTANGYTNRSLAAALEVAPSTVDHWLASDYGFPIMIRTVEPIEERLRRYAG